MTSFSYRPEGASQRLCVDIQDGCAVVGSDAHIWPGVTSTGFRAFIKIVRLLKPELVCLNGDVFDGSSISKHPRIGWERVPNVAAELAECQRRLKLLERTSTAIGAVMSWNLGNHDARFETFIANHASEYKNVPGVHLKDHFPAWEPAWSTWVNAKSETPVIIKHRPGGNDNGRNLEASVRRAGTHLVVGHTHRGQVVRVSTFQHDLFGVNCGMLAPKYGPQFIAYTEDAVQDWSTSFVVLTFRRGKLLWPEMVHVTDERAGEFTFRGETYCV